MEDVWRTQGPLQKFRTFRKFRKVSFREFKKNIFFRMFFLLVERYPEFVFRFLFFRAVNRSMSERLYEFTASREEFITFLSKDPDFPEF